MQMTVNIDDGLLKDAQESSGVQEPSALVERALRVMLEREAARRLANMGGTAPDLKPIPRRHFASHEEAAAALEELRKRIGWASVDEILELRDEGRR